MPMTGLPSKRSPGKPWFFIQLRWPNPSLSALPNQSALRSLRGAFAIIRFLPTGPVSLRLILPSDGLRRNGFASSGGGALPQLGEQLGGNGDAVARQAAARFEPPLAREANGGVLQHRRA